MTDPQPIAFVPKWYRGATSDVREALDIVGSLGNIAPGPVRLVARILPTADAYALPASIVGEVIDVTQKLMQYAANDEIKGYNPNFADLRSIGQDVAEISKLTIEPFEGGSFVIPARLDASDYEEGPRTVTTESVVKRFNQILDEVATSTAPQVSFGALQAAGQLKSTLTRAADAIEFHASGPQLRAEKRVLDRTFTEKVHRVITSRRPSAEILDELVGEVTAIDLDNQEVQIRIANQRTRVKGSFYAMLHPTLLTSLGRKVQLYGKVQYRGSRVLSIAILEAERLDY